MTGADAGSDHHLLVGKLQLKLKRSVRPVANRVKYDINLSKVFCIAQQFSITIRNKYQVLQDMQDVEDSIDDGWEKLKRAWTSVGRSNKTKHGYLIILSLRSSRSDQRRRTSIEHAQDCKDESVC